MNPQVGSISQRTSPHRPLELPPFRNCLLSSAFPNDFDFLFREVVDSFGILEMIMSIENEFHIKLDMAALEAEQITILGLLSRYVAEYRGKRSIRVRLGVF
jgi:acyl carrier protein